MARERRDTQLSHGCHVVSIKSSICNRGTSIRQYISHKKRFTVINHGKNTLKKKIKDDNRSTTYRKNKKKQNKTKKNLKILRRMRVMKVETENSQIVKLKPQSPKSKGRPERVKKWKGTFLMRVHLLGWHVVILCQISLFF